MQDGDPTPENPIEIKNTGDNGSVNEKVQNKNLLNVSNVFEITGYRSIPINLKANENYIVSASKISEAGNTKDRLLGLLNEDNTTSYIYSFRTTNLTINIKPSKNVKSILIYSQNGYTQSVGITSVFYDLMISKEEGKYQPHEEQTLSFPLAEGQKFMEGDYLADDGVHHKRIERVFDGSDDENWSLQSINSNGIANFAIGLADYSGRDENLSLCDYFSSQSTPIAQTTNEGYYLTISKTLYIRIKSTTASTVAELRTWLSNHNMKFQYELVEEQTEDFTEEQKTAWGEWKKARTYKNVTHISSEDETPANVEIEYVQDTKTYIDNKVTALTNAIISLGGNI